MELFSGIYDEYSYTPSAAFDADEDVLPDIKEEAETAIDTGVGTVRAIELYSASTFTVQLNDRTILEAYKDGSVYYVKFVGMVTECIFAAETTITHLRIAY